MSKEKEILAQEAQGQKNLVNSDRLPIKCNFPRNTDTKKIYEELGFKIIGPNGIFRDVELPKGWEKKATDHSMWSHLYDDKGRERASIFYKASYHDTDAFININRRINFKVDRVGFHNENYELVDGEYVSRKTPYCGIVKDYDGTILFKTEEVDFELEYNEPNNKGGYKRECVEKMHELEGKLEGKCLAFLKGNHSDWENPVAYWDLEIKKY